MYIAVSVVYPTKCTFPTIVFPSLFLLRTPFLSLAKELVEGNAPASVVMSWKQEQPPTEDDEEDSLATEYSYEDPPPAHPASILCCPASPPEKKRKTTRNMASANWMDRMKKAGKSVVDAGAKTMLRVRRCGDD